jgi:hypothetical protein
MKRHRIALRNQIADLLQTLGDDAQHVAASLAEAGVRGKPRNAEGCPVAVFVKAVVGADPRVRTVTVYNACLAVRGPSRWRRPLDVHLPAPVRGFIVAFDAERFPALMPARSTLPIP